MCAILVPWSFPQQDICPLQALENIDVKINSNTSAIAEE